jgi:mannitol/fructose-specific phosphotransferase system IIA component/galactitol-specific phosphotransferase system IIB component
MIKIYVVCDAGMGSSALGASLLRKEFKESKLSVSIQNVPIDMDMQDADVLVTHKHFESSLKKHYPDKRIFGLEDFLNKNNLKKVIHMMETMENAVLLKENIRVNLETISSDEAIVFCGKRLVESGYVEEKYIQGMLDRDHSLSVFMGNKIALPHGEYEYKKNILKSGIVVDIYPNGIDWHGEMVNLVVGLAGIGEDHMQILSNIATVFGEIEEVDKVLVHQDVEEIYRLLTQEVQE